MADFSSLSVLSNVALLEEGGRLAANERSSTVALIVVLTEIDKRRLYLSEGHSCMFHYCTKTLLLSEAAAYSRIEVARVARLFPQILDALTRGVLSPTTAMLVAPHLTAGIADELINAASFKTRREVERLIAERHPQPDVPTIVKKQAEPRRPVAPNRAELALPAPDAVEGAAMPSDRHPESPAVLVPQPSRPAVVAPLSGTRYKIQFTADQDTHDKLRHAQALLRHQIPSGDVATIVNKALTLLIADVERRKLGLVKHPRHAARALAEGSRHIPAAVRREVSQRDEGQCAFMGRRGRCTERGRLEFHHVVPFAAGGKATVDNIELRCRAHNGYEAERFFGPEVTLLFKETAPAYQ